MQRTKPHISKEARIRVLVAEDNRADATLILRILERSDLAHFEVETADRLSSAIDKALRNPFDIAILDLFLPDSTGLETLENFLHSVRSTPVIVLTGYEEESIGIEAIRKGAEEYIFKGELPDASLARFISMSVERSAARILSSLQPSFETAEKNLEVLTLHFGPLRIDLLNQKVFKKIEGTAEIEIALTPSEFRILVMMVRHPGEILSRSRIVSELWRKGESQISVRTVDRHLSALKNKVEPALNELESVYGVGYRLNAEG